jgi:hypothetical protein
MPQHSCAAPQPRVRVNHTLARWAVRSQCCGALHQALSNLNLYAAACWCTSDDVDREARALVTRYAIAAYQLLFIEARAAVRSLCHMLRHGT